MHKQFTQEQQKKIDRLYRKEMWSIKAIARILAVSDKRVSAYLRGEEMAGEKITSSGTCHGKHKVIKASDSFHAIGKEVLEWADKALCDCSAQIHNTIMDCIKDVLVSKKKMTKKEIKKDLDRQLEKLYGVLGDAMCKVAIAAFWALPSNTKKIWIESISQKPSENTRKEK